MKIAIFGLGYVGLTGAACLLKGGHSILGIDASDKKIATLLEGKCPIYEPGVADLLAEGRAQNRFRVSDRIPEEFSDVEVAFVCVGTPSSATGSHNMNYIAEVTRQIAEACTASEAAPLTVCYRSTVVPGTMERLVAPIFSAFGKDRCVDIVYNPEFMRESTAIADYFEPSRIVVGTSDGSANAALQTLYKDIQAPYFNVHYKEAEVIKLLDNTFHALKTAFGNEMGRLCAASGIDVQAVHEIFVADTKLNISKRYLRPGAAFGGSCLPKDVRAFSSLATRCHVQTPIVDAILRSNDAHKSYCFTKVKQGLQPGAKLLVNGLSFKKNTDDLRESPFVDLVEHLIEAGYDVMVHDPNVTVGTLIGQNLTFAFQSLPDLKRILLDLPAVERMSFDRLVDVRGDVDPKLAARCKSCVSIAQWQ